MMFLRKKKVFLRVIIMLLIVSILGMSCPSLTFASEQTSTSLNTTSIERTNNMVADSLNQYYKVQSSNDTNNQMDSNITQANNKRNEMMEKIYKYKYEAIKNLRVVNTQTEKTLLDGATSTDSSDNNSSISNSTDGTNKTIVKELVEKREANVKHFLMDDMTEEALIYPASVHYLVNGQWKQIDNTMIESDEDTFTNKSNDFKVNIAKDTSSDELVKIKNGKYEIAWGIKDTENSTTQVINDENKELLSLSENEKKTYIKNLNSNIIFSNIFPNIDLDYKVNSNSLKENIVINSPTDLNTFVFNLNTKNVTPQAKDKINPEVTNNGISEESNAVTKDGTENATIEGSDNVTPQETDNGSSQIINSTSPEKIESLVTEDNIIIFYDSEDGSEVFSFSAPVMYDANGEFSKDIIVKLTPNEENYILSITPSQDWLNDSNRVYPITIDPTITVNLPSQISNAIVKQGSPDTSYNGYAVSDLEVGNGTGTDGAEMSYLKFNLPELSSSDMVTSAKISLYEHTNFTPQINLYGVISDWDISSLTYNNQPSHNNAAEDYVKLTTSTTETVSWDITRLTKDWYISGNNCGILLKSMTDNTTGSGLAKFYSTGYTDTAKRPYITINYINCSGLQNYWSYHTQSVGRAGTIYTNNYNGNSIIVHNDASITGRLPITLSHIYNSDDKDIDLGYGKGWRLNFNQTIEVVDSTSTSDLKYTDEDGTVHYFKYKSISGAITTYKDNSGLSLTLKKDTTNNIYTIQDKKGYILTFDLSTDGSGKLQSIKDNDDNTIEINYSNGKIDSITLNNPDNTTVSLDLEYNDDNGLLKSVTDADNRMITYHYTDNQLDSITYPDNKSSTYIYNDTLENLVTTVKNYDNYQATIEYYNNGDFYKVFRVQEIGTDETTCGKSYTITYLANGTKFVDDQGRTTIWQFNDNGDISDIQYNDGSAQFIEYDTSSDALPNQIATQSKLQKTVSNLVENPSFERTIDDEWTALTFGTNTATVSTTYRKFGNKSAKIVNNVIDVSCFTQALAVTPGKTYTLSAYVKTVNVTNESNLGAFIDIAYYNNGWFGINSNYLTGTKDWQRMAVTLTVPSNVSTITIDAYLVTETGTVYFDDFQLEEGNTSSRYNLVENGDFSSYDTSDNPNYWTKSTNCTNDDKVTMDTDTHPTKLDGNTFTFNGDAANTKNISKTITVSGSAGDIFILGGWAKGDSAPITGSRLFDIELKFGTGSAQKVSFNPSCDDWQYVAKAVKAPASYTSITISVNYSYNINSASFDGIQLYKEDYGKTYDYDSNGNLTSVVDLANQTQTFTFSTNNDLTSYVDSLGNNFTYTYDSKHHRLTSTSGAGVKQTFTIDSNGNTTNIKAGSSSSTSINASATYTSNGNYNSAITDPLGNIITYKYSEKNGNLDLVNDPKNNSTYYQYNNLGLLTNTYSTGKDIPAESFNFENHTTMGSKGTKPLTTDKDNPYYVTDENNHYVFNTGANQHVEYTLNVKDNSGTMLLWFNPSALNPSAKQYLIANDTTNISTTTLPFRLLFDTDNKLKVEVKNSSGTLTKQTITSDAITAANTWYYGGLSWRLNGTSLEYTIYLNDKAYSGSTTSFKDFSGATTTLGQLNTEVNKFYGMIDQFVYSPLQLTQEDINKGSDSIYLKGRGNYFAETTECFTLNETSTGSRGTNAEQDSKQYENDENNKPVLVAADESIRKLQYSLGINKASGTMCTWFKTSNDSSQRYILSNEFISSNAMLDLYVDTDNILKLQVRDTDNNPLVLSSGVTITNDVWYFGGYTWNYSGTSSLPNIITLKLYLNNNVYTVDFNDNFKDFSLAKTTLGGDVTWSNSLNGMLDQFIYSNRCFSQTVMQSIYNSGRGNYLSSNCVNNGYTYESDKLSTIFSNGVNYHYIYDVFGNIIGVSIGNQSIIANSYNDSEGNYTCNLTRSSYANGSVVDITYDDMNRITKKTYDGNDLFEYGYNDSGDMGYLQDNENGATHHYYYDFANRLTMMTSDYYYMLQNGMTSFTYDNDNNLIKMVDTIDWNNATQTGDIPYTTSYVYDGDNRVTSVTTSGGGNNGKFTTTYDTATDLGRITANNIYYNNYLKYTTTYAYRNGFGVSSGATSKLLASITNGGTTISYTYDKNRNIQTITEGSNTIKYTYNELNELIREDNPVLNKIIVYTYDKGANILSKVQYPYTADGTLGTPTATNSYSYTDSNWNDKLTSYNGLGITYDEIGNPLTYNGNTYTWERGRELAGISGNGLTISYKYDSNGVRTKKTVNSRSYTYQLVGDKVTFEDNGEDGIYYSYDPNGKLVSMNLSGTEYFYVRNAQNDIIKLVNASGATVAGYIYDTWGKLVSIKDGSGNDITNDTSSIGYKNPYRYREYRYDSETGLYYLQSRYYNPEWGRFLNADSVLGNPSELLSHNLYAYCYNNPVSLVDSDGKNPMLVGALIGAVVGGVAGAVISYNQTGSVDWGAVGAGALGGALIGSGVGLIAGATAAGVTGAALADAAVIGSYSAGYTRLGLSTGRCFFSIPQSTWNAMSRVEQWAANQRFLDSMISQGRNFVCSNSAWLAEEGTGFYDEIQYLVNECGYVIAEDGMSLIKF